MCFSFQHGCTQQFVAHWAVLLHRQVVLASFCWEITGGHAWCRENVGIVRETGIVLVAMNSDSLMVGLMKSCLALSTARWSLQWAIAWTPERLSKTPGLWPAWSSQIGPRYWETSESLLKHLPRKGGADRGEKRERREGKGKKGERKKGGKKGRKGEHSDRIT